MLLKELLAKKDFFRIEGNEETNVAGIVSDSQKVMPGDVFVCVKGSKRDGHDFIPEALKRGCSALVLERTDEFFSAKLRENIRQIRPDTPPVLVMAEDSPKLLAGMAAAYYGNPASELMMIGITGTKGKTTTAYMIRSILENAGRRVGLIGTNEVIIGREHFPSRNTTPDALTLHKLLRDMADQGMDTAVMEVSSQAVKRKRTEGISFDYGVFTNLSPDHIAPGEHADFQEYLACKSRLFGQCKTGLVNGDDIYHEEILRGHTCIAETFGTGKNCMLRAERTEYLFLNGHPGVRFKVGGLMDFSVELPMPGAFSVYNALAAISVCRHFRVRESDIQRALLTAGVRGRMETIPGPGGSMILIDYAHNPMALHSLLGNLKQYPVGRLICLFGCGGDRPVLRRKQMGRISGDMADLTILTNDNPRSEDPEKILEQIAEGIRETQGRYLIIADRREAIRYGIEMLGKGDMLVLAGKGHETMQEIKGRALPLDERKIVQEILAK